MTRAAIIWKVHRPTTVIAILLLPCLLGLGYWQLQRADQKRALLAEYQLRRSAPPVTLQNLPAQPEQYRRVEVKGRYDNQHNFLLDNRISQGRFGYEVLTPFQPEGGSPTLLVDRGWLAGDPARLQQPAIAPVTGTVDITGHVYREGEHFHFVSTLAEKPGDAARWPKTVQSLQLEVLQKSLGRPLLLFVVRLDDGVPGAYETDWQVVNIGFGPQRHIAYAVTWFTMAATLVLLWLLRSSNIGSLIRGK